MAKTQFVTVQSIYTDMTRILLTKEAVKNAINSLKQQGVYPSLERIRKITGGSTQRISKIRKELDSENEATSQPDDKNTPQSDNKKYTQDVFSRIETRMVQMEVLFSQRLTNIQSELKAKVKDKNEACIQELQTQIQKLEFKNTLLLKQLNKEIARVKEVSQMLRQTKNRIAELEMVLANMPTEKPEAISPHKVPSKPKAITIKDDVSPKKNESGKKDRCDSEIQQAVIRQFHARLNAQWGEEQNAEIALQKIARQYLMEKWAEDSHLLDSAVLDSNINEKCYAVVSVSEHKGAKKLYVVHCLILDRNSEQLHSQRQEYKQANAAHDKVHQWLNNGKL
jgi:hypothetical protein